MTLVEIFLSVFIPILISLVAYFGHKHLESIEQELKDLKKSAQDLKESQSRLDRHMEILNTITKNHMEKVETSVKSIKATIDNDRNFSKSIEKRVNKTDETQGKILMILGKVITELKRPKP